MLPKSRSLRIALLLLLALLFGGYFAFSTFVFNPLEGDFKADVSTLVPRNVDFFLAKARLAEDFDPFPRFAFEKTLADTPGGRAFASSPELDRLERSLSLQQMRAELEALPKQLLGVAPLSVFGGRDVSVAGWFRGPLLEQADWAVYGRVNWMGKLGASALRFPGLIGLSKQGLRAAVESGHVALSGDRLPREIYVTRVRDVVVAGTSLDLIKAVSELEGRAGQDSFGQSAQYFDHIQNAERSARRDELELYVDWRSWSEQRKLTGRWPDPQSPDLVTALFGHFFQIGSIKSLSGVIGAHGGVQARLHADLSTELITPEQSRFYRLRGADHREILSEAARLAPEDTGLFAYMHVGLGDLLRQWLEASEPALRTNFDDLLRSTGKFTGTDAFIEEMNALFRDRVALIVRQNDYPAKPEADPPNDGQPTFAIAVVLWTDGSEKARDRINELHDLVTRNQRQLGLSGGSPDKPDGVYKNSLPSGHEIWEFWSMFVPGTGHLASVIDDRRYVLANSFRMLGDVIGTFYQRGRPSLADKPEFKALLDEGLDQANVLAWVAPRELGKTLRPLSERAARDAVMSGIDRPAERAREEALLLRSEFGGRQAKDLPLDDKERLDQLLDARMGDLETRLLRERGGALQRTWMRYLEYAELFHSGLAMLALDPKQIELSLQLVIPSDGP